MVMNKRGQAFLMAAIIIAGLVLGASKIANTAKAGNDGDAFYDLTKEVKFEADWVLDRGVIAPGDFGGTFDQNDVKDFLSKYNDYISSEEVLFIWGDANGANYYAIRYYNAPINAVSLSTGGPTAINQQIDLTTATSAQIIGSTSDITVTIRGIDYTFNLSPGQKFYFVLIKDENGEKFVAKR